MNWVKRMFGVPMKDPPIDSNCICHKCWYWYETNTGDNYSDYETCVNRDCNVYGVDIVTSRVDCEFFKERNNT